MTDIDFTTTHAPVEFRSRNQPGARYTVERVSGRGPAGADGGGGGGEAVEIDLAPGVGPILLGSTAVDGTATDVTVIRAQPGAEASGAVPAGYVGLATISLATADGVIPDGSQFCVPAGTGVGVYVWNTGDMDEAWEEVDCAVGRWAFCYLDDGAGTVFQWVAVRADNLFVQVNSADAQAYKGAGLIQGVDNVRKALDELEGTLDTWHMVTAFTDENIDLSLYVGVPTDPQPTLARGTVPKSGPAGGRGGGVFVNAQTDPTENGFYVVDADDGSWSRELFPSTLIGNGSQVHLRDTSGSANGWWWEWLDNDPQARRRRSVGWPNSSYGESDGSGGVWTGPHIPHTSVGPPYTPAEPTDWDSSPTSVAAGLNELADRVPTPVGENDGDVLTVSSDALVYATPSAGSVVATPMPIYDGGSVRDYGIPGSMPTGSGSAAVSANRPNFGVFRCETATSFVGACIYVAAGAGTNARAAVYACDTDWQPVDLVVDFGLFGTATAGLKNAAAVFDLDPGIYTTVLVCDGTPTLAYVNSIPPWGIAAETAFSTFRNPQSLIDRSSELAGFSDPAVATWERDLVNAGGLTIAHRVLLRQAA